MSELDEINAILSASNIPALAAQADRREQAAQSMKRQRRKQESDFAQAVMLQAMKDKAKGDGFQGTSMEAQMLNIWNDPNIPADDPRKVQAQRFLSRATTYSVGDTTYTRPGILGEVTQTAVPTDAQIAAGNAVALGDANKAATGVAGQGKTEASWWDLGVSMIPFVDADFMQTDAWRNQNVAAEAWTETYAKTVKGGGQVTDDDRKQVRETYWPKEGDDTAQINLKAKLRQNTEQQARETASGGRVDFRYDPVTKKLVPVK